MSRLPCGHPEQAVVTDPDGTSFCAVCAGLAFACDNPEAGYIADLGRSLSESADQKDSRAG